MERREDMKNYLQLYRVKWLKERAKKMESGITASIKEELQPILLEMTEEILEKQKHKKANKIAYLAIFYLRSSIVTGSHEYMVMLADNSLYLDNSRLERYWYPARLYESLPENIALAQKEIEKQFIRVTDYEMDYISQMMEEDFFDIMEIGLSKNLSKILNTEQFAQMNKETGFCCIYGEYMGQVKTIKNMQL